MRTPGPERRWFRRLLPRWHAVETEVAEELDYHLERRTAELVARGLEPGAARAAALREFGDVGAAARDLAAIDRGLASRERRTAWWADLGGDVRFGLRTLRRAPGFTILLVLILGLGIGSNTAMFTVLRAALLQSLPYRDSDRLVHLWETTGNRRSEASYPDFRDWRAQDGAFSGLEGYNQTNISVREAAGATMRRGGRVTAGFFALLGVEPVLGRSFRAEEDGAETAPVVLLSHPYWQSRFGGDPAVLDSSVTLDGRPYRVIGVLPAGFHFAPVGEAEFWLTLGGGPVREQRYNHWVNVIGRLRDGVTLGAAATSLNTIMRRLADEFPQSNQGRRAELVPLRDQVIGRVRPVLLALGLAMGLVLAVVCANVAGLFLARATGREQEIQVRVALGATRWRLARQLLVESLLLALAGGFLALLLGHAGTRLAVGALPEGTIDHLPFLRGLSPDAAVLGYAAGLALLTAVVFGLGPIRHALGVGAGRPGPGPRATASGRRLRDGLVVGEIALTLVLVAGTVLLARSLVATLGLRLGYEPAGVVTLRASLAGPRYQTAASQQQFFDRLVAGSRELPGVKYAGAVSRLPLNGGGTNSFRVDGAEEQPASRRPSALTRGVAGDYFAALGIPLLAGRVFDRHDDSTSRPVLVVSASVARRFFPTGRAVGQRLRFYALPDSAWEIVGVVGDVRTGALDADPPPTIYYSHLQSAENRMSLVVRGGSQDPGGLARALVARVRAIDPGVAVYHVGPLADDVGASAAVAARRVPLLLVGGFAAIALLLALVGVYGVVSFNVARRTREFGIRVALGATPGRILWMVTRSGAMLALWGVGLGLLLTVGMSRTLRALVAGLGAGDPVPPLAAGLLLAMVTLAAALIPARRATRLDPTTALRAE